MNKVETNCKNCGAPLQYNENEKIAKCSYCKTEYYIDLSEGTVSKFYAEGEVIIEIGERLV